MRSRTTARNALSLKETACRVVFGSNAEKKIKNEISFIILIGRSADALTAFRDGQRAQTTAAG